MPPRHWSRAWQRVTFLKLLSGLTLPPSTVEAGAASWIASLRATRASPTASPESEPAPPTIASLSTRCFASSTKAGRFVSSAKTSLGTPTGNSPPLSDHWKQWATALRQESSARPKLAPATAATDCSSWPTPRTITGGPETAQRKQELGRLESGGGDLQSAALAANWSTPRASDGEKGGPNMSFGAGGTPLPTQAAAWPTPAARDGKGANSAEHVTTTGTGRRHLGQLPNFVEHCFSPPAPATQDGPKSSPVRRVLNPRFVEWLMGWPIGWTDCEPVATGSSAWLQRARGWLSTLCTPMHEPQQGLLL
jgi:hypothetical protein